MLTTQPSINAPLPDDQNLDLATFLKKKDRHRRVKKGEEFLAKDIKCALRVTGRFYFTCRLYCVHSLFVERGSLLYRALKEDNSNEYFKFSLKDVRKDGIYYETIEVVDKCNFGSKKSAFEYAEKLKKDCQEGLFNVSKGHYANVFKHLLNERYCKAESARSIGANAKVLKEIPNVIQVRALQAGEYQHIHKLILKFLGQNQGGIATEMTSHLDIQPFKYAELPTQFFYVDCTRFFLAWKTIQGNKTEYHNSDAVVKSMFLLMINHKGKLKRLTSFSAPSFSLQDFAAKKWDNFPLRPKTFFKAISTQHHVKVAHKQKVATHVRPGSILRVDDERIAIVARNGYVLKVVPKGQMVSNGPAYMKMRLEDFIGNVKEFREIIFSINRYRVNELETRAEKFNTTRDSRAFLKRSCDENAMYLVGGLEAVVKPGVFKTMFTKPAHRSMHI